MIYTVPRGGDDAGKPTARIHVEMLGRDARRPIHTQTQNIQIEVKKIKSLPEVYHPACERATGSTSLSLLVFWGRGGWQVCLSHTGTKFFPVSVKLIKYCGISKRHFVFLMAYN